MAKFSPIEPLASTPGTEKNAVFMPMNSPFMLNSGPPELPGLIEASICMKASSGVSLMLRSRALMMPVVTVPARPSGLPSATTWSPWRIRSLLPNFTGTSGFSGDTRSSAMSMSGER